MLSITDKMNKKALLKIFDRKLDDLFSDTYVFYVDSLDAEKTQKQVLITKKRFWSKKVQCYSLFYDLCVKPQPLVTPIEPHNLFQFIIAFIQNPFKKAVMSRAGFAKEYDGERYSNTSTYCFIKKEFINYLTIKELEEWISYFKEHMEIIIKYRSGDKK